MNHIKLAHTAGASYTLGGRGKLYINGHEVRGVLDLKPDVMDTNSVASVTITLAVSEFVFGGEQPTQCAEAQQAFVSARWA